MGILDWWRRGHTSAEGGPDAAAVDEAVEHIVQTANPRLRFARRYAQRLAPAVATAMAYAEEIVDAAPPAREATTAGWAVDPAMRAFFATPDDIVQAFSRSVEVRAFFDQNPLADEAFAVVGMQMSERQVVGVALQGSVMRRDVVQTTVSFGDYRVRVLGATEAELRAEIARRIVDQLVLDGIARAAAEQTEREAAEQERALLKTRLRYLEQQGQGMRAALGGEGEADPSALASVQAALEENTRTLESMTTGADRLDEELERIVESLADARQRFYLSTTRLRLDRMNVVQTDDSPEAGEEIVFQSARIPGEPPETRAFALVRFPRADLLPAETLRYEAVRHLL
jgi:hypothetical protein